MTTITDAKEAVYNYLTEMELSPTDLKIISFDAEKEQFSWFLEGKFRGGFMGSHYTFNVKFDPLTNNITKMDVKEVNDSTEGYA